MFLSIFICSEVINRCIGNSIKQQLRKQTELFSAEYNSCNVYAFREMYSWNNSGWVFHFPLLTPHFGIWSGPESLVFA